MKRFLMTACLVCAVSFLPQQARPQQPPPAQEPKKPVPKQSPSEKAEPTPARETNPPARQNQEKAPEKTPGEIQDFPATEKRPGEEPSQPQAAGKPTPTVLPTASPTVQPTPTAQPTQTVQPAQTVEETQSRTAGKVDQQASPQPIDSPPTVVERRTADGERPPWSFRREMEVLAQAFSFGKLLLSILILLFGYSANKFLTLLVARTGTGKNSYTEWLRWITPFVRLGLWLIIVQVIVQIFTQSLLALVLLITVAALALAFASQPLLRDLLGGLVILFGHPFRHGDHVTVGGHRGEVKEMGLRAFRLTSHDGGSVISVPNATVLGEPVINASPGMTESQVTMELPLPDDWNLEWAKRIAFEAAAVSPYACIHKPVEVYFEAPSQNHPHPRIIVQAYVFDGRYERQLRTDIVERTRRGFQSLRSVISDEYGHTE